MLFHDVAEGGGLAGELGQPGADRGVMVGVAGVQAGELLGVGGELVDDGGDRVGVGHGQFQGKRWCRAAEHRRARSRGGRAWPLRRGELGVGRAEAAGAAVGGVFQARGSRAMTGAPPPRMTRANPAGSWRIMSGVATSWRVACSWPRTFHDACPHSVLAAWSVVVSVMPGRNTFTELVSEHDLGAMIPPFGELGFAVDDGDDLDALAAPGVRQPGRQRDRADLG